MRRRGNSIPDQNETLLDATTIRISRLTSLYFLPTNVVPSHLLLSKRTIATAIEIREPLITHMVYALATTVLSLEICHSKLPLVDIYLDTQHMTHSASLA